MSSYVKYQDQPGVFSDDTALTAAVHYVDSNQIEWERGKWQIRRGHESATNDTFDGVCRGLYVWSNLLAQPLAAIGTHTGVYAYFDADLYDITPIVTLGTVSNPFTTVNASATVTFALASHGLVDDQRIVFPNSTAVNGADISDADGYAVTVVDANSVTFTASSAATSSGSGVGGTTDYDFLLAPGPVDGMLGYGFGVGAFDVGPFGEAGDTAEFYPRTWSLDSWGQNLVANPRGGALYEWAPAYSAPEEVTNGNFAAGTDWTLGTGWSIGAGVATMAAGSASLMSQQLALDPAAYYLLQVDVTWSAGTVTPTIDGTAIGDAINATGRYRRVFYSGAGLLAFSKDAAAIGTIDNVSVKQMLRLTRIPNSPAQNTCMRVTAEDMIAVGGTIALDTSEFDPLVTRWCARRNNQLWVPGFAEGNTSGQYRLAAGASRIVQMLRAKGETLILTDDTPYVARFNADPSINYSFADLVGGFGSAGANAGAIAGGVAWWATVKGEFARYAGGLPEIIPCTVRQTFVNNAARAQNDKIYASAVGTAQIQFLYADSRDGNECSRYIKFNHAEPAWDQGISARSAWTDKANFGFELATSIDGHLYFQEKGSSADGAPLSWLIESGAFTLRDGKIAQIMGLRPDFKDLLGGALLTVKCWLPDEEEPQEFGPYPITAATRKVDLRTQGSMIAFRLEGTSAPAGGRSGTMQIDVRDTRCGR